MEKVSARGPETSRLQRRQVIERMEPTSELEPPTYEAVHPHPLGETGERMPFRQLVLGVPLYPSLLDRLGRGSLLKRWQDDTSSYGSRNKEFSVCPVRQPSTSGHCFQ
jgi:hypothetical protein